MPIINSARMQQGLQPPNTQTVKPSDVSLRNLSAQAKQRNINALSVNPTYIIVYRKLTSGPMCSCCGSTIKDPFDDAGVASTDHIQSLLHNSKFGVSDYSDLTGIKQESVTIGSIFPHNETVNDMSQMGDIIEYDAVEEDDGFMLNTNLSLCSVCLGTGIVGGYDIFGGKRVILTPETAEGGHGVNISNAPHSFNMNNTNCTWKLLLPKGVNHVVRLSVFNNTKELPVSAYDLEITLDGITKTANNVSIKEMSVGKEVELTLIAKGNIEFTHLELMYYYYPQYVKSDLGQLSMQSDITKQITYNDINVCITPELTYINPDDLFTDTLYGQLWRVTSVETVKDANNNIYTHTVGATVVQPNDVQYVLCLNRKMLTTNLGTPSLNGNNFQLTTR